MNVEVDKTDEVTVLFDTWYAHMRAQDMDEAEKLKSRVAEWLETIEEDPMQSLHYSLLQCRYKLLLKDLDGAKAILDGVERFKDELDDQLSYYFYFFRGIYSYNVEDYQKALADFQIAKKIIDKEMNDNVEIAEFYSKIAAVYYHIRQPLLSIEYIEFAKSCLQQKSHHKSFITDCENLLGLCSMSLKQFEQAEIHLNRALDHAQKHEDPNRMLHIRFNLGLLYSEQNLSEVAIRHLKTVRRHKYHLHKTLFLLAREYFRMGENEKAAAIIEEGIEFCHRQGNMEYIHHLNILKDYHSNVELEQLEKTVNEGISYFEKKELLGFIQDYAEKLAKRFYINHQRERAGFYYHLAHEAKEKLLEQEALK